jgi:hypothetical protein
MIPDTHGQDEVKQAFDFLQTNETSLSLNQIDFINSLKKDYTRKKKLSDSQQSILLEIKNYVEERLKKQTKHY